MNRDQMLLLLKEIEDYPIRCPDARGVSIVEGEISDMQPLLYILKGKRVIGLFNDVDIPMGDGNDALEDRVYFFDVDWDAFKKFKTNFLSNKDKELPLLYNPKTGRGSLRGKKFSFRIQNRKAKVLAKLYEQIGEPLKRSDVLKVAEYNKINTEESFLSELVKDIRKATGLTTEELILNNDLTLVVPLE